MLIEKTKEEIEKEKEVCFEQQKTDLLNSLYILFQKFDEELDKDNFNKIDENIVLSIIKLLLSIEEQNFISVDDVDKKLDGFKTYKMFKSKNTSMKLIPNASTNLKKTNHNLYGGGFLQLAILGVGIAATLVNLTSAAIGTTVGALKEDTMVKSFAGSLEKARAFKSAMENKGGSCAFNTEFQTKGQGEFNKTVNFFKYTHAPEFIAQSIDDLVRINPGATYDYHFRPISHGYNARGIDKYNAEHNITENISGNDYQISDGKFTFLMGQNIQKVVKNWDDTLFVSRALSQIVYSNWETSTNATSGDICIFFLGFMDFNGGHAFNGIVRKVNGEYKIGAIDSNDYTYLIDIDSKGNIVPGKAYKNGWIRVEPGFFTPDEEKILGKAIIKTDNPLLSVYDRYKLEIELFGYKLYKYRNWNNPSSEFSITFENNKNEDNYGNFPTPTTGNMAIVDFGVTDYQSFVEAKNMVNNIASNYFDIIENYPGTSYNDYTVNNNCLDNNSCRDNFFQHKTTFGGKKNTKRTNKKRTKKMNKKNPKKINKKRTKKTYKK